jgi:hypothetical protein
VGASTDNLIGILDELGLLDLESEGRGDGPGDGDDAYLFDHTAEQHGQDLVFDDDQGLGPAQSADHLSI